MTVAAGIVVFAVGAFAQDDKPIAPATPSAPQKAARPFKGDRADFGPRKAGHEGFKGHGKGGQMAMLHGLNLTDAQKEQIRGIIQANKPDQANIDKIKSFREAKKEGTLPTPEQKAQMKAFRQQAQAKAKSVHEQMLNVLTADQKAQLDQQRQQMKERREEFRKNRPAKPATTDKPKTI